MRLFETLSAMTELQEVDLNFRRCDYDEVLRAIAMLPSLRRMSFLFWDTSVVFAPNSDEGCSLLDSMISLIGTLRLSHSPSRCSLTELKLRYVDIDLGIHCPQDEEGNFHVVSELYEHLKVVRKAGQELEGAIAALCSSLFAQQEPGTPKRGDRCCCRHVGTQLHRVDLN